MIAPHELTPGLPAPQASAPVPVFQSRCMHALLERVRRFARASASVLITGESGTGKELLARRLHEAGPRVGEPYVRVNCAALPRNLIESELFGHESGAFTGASNRRIGRFEAAAGGTIFLDEIGELPLAMQVKLLRVLEENEFQRVGSNQDLHLHARVVAATNRTLEERVRKKRFRQDLYHRLNILALHIPPLRERREDIPVLVSYFIQRFRNEAEVAIRGVSSSVMRQLSDYHWPGNVRQLRNVIHRACILATGEIIDEVDLPSEDEPQTGTPQKLPAVFEQLPLREIERIVILSRLRRFDGNKTEAAAALGVTPRTLRNKVTEYRKLGFSC
ncbi:sigma-54 dependent transcriptional regulator [Maioricimonas sp. JC845]|uniref:sigma-54 interaction domain-containing protein n=1 Tax=Maioricimonas sp. JC845 TaxID=3232138 RepID=UPI0034599940